MSPRNMILLVAAILVSAVVAIVVRSQTKPAADSPVKVEAKQTQNKILVAKSDIPAGSFVNSTQHLQWADWPENAVLDTHIMEKNESLTSFNGSVARRSIRTGEAITASSIIKPGAGGFLSAVLEPGMRAVSVAVSPTTGTAGFIFPGDRVDLIVTHRINVREQANLEDIESVVSETFVRNARVVAVDQMLDNPENKAILAKTVTVEVSPKDAEKISVAQDLGKISFALRSIATDANMVAANENEEKVEAEGEAVGGPETLDYLSAIEQNGDDQVAAGEFTRDSEISQVLDRRGAATPRIMVIRGDKSEKREFYRGAK